MQTVERLAEFRCSSNTVRQKNVSRTIPLRARKRSAALSITAFPNSQLFG